MPEDKLIIESKKSKECDGHKVFSIRIKEEIVKKIDNIYASTGRSRNELIGMFLEQASVGSTN